MRRNPLLLKRGKQTLMGNRPLREYAARHPDMDDNILVVGPFGNVGAMFGHHPSTHVCYFLIDPDKDKDVLIAAIRGGKLPVFHMHRAGFMGPGTIETFWKQNAKLTRFMAAAAQFVPLSDKVIVTHIAVKPGWQDRGVAYALMDNIAYEHPDVPLFAHELTRDGRVFLGRYQAPDGRRVTEYEGHPLQEKEGMPEVTFK